MTLKDFAKKYPHIIDFDRAGVEGIDFGALSVKIEQSRLLKKMCSFIFFVNNYSKILEGKYDDFPTLHKQQSKTADLLKAEQEREFLKSNLRFYRALNISEEIEDEMKVETGVRLQALIDALYFALSTPSAYSIQYAKELRLRVQTFLKDKKII